MLRPSVPARWTVVDGKERSLKSRIPSTTQGMQFELGR